MYRFLLTPRWCAITVFVVLAVPLCLVMGGWQLGRFEAQVDSHRDQREQRASAATAPARPLTSLLPVTTDTVGEPAEVTGVYDAGRQLLVPERTLDGERGFYVLTPLRPRGGGPAVPVVRGWLPGAADAVRVPAPPAGEVTVTGALQAAESPRGVNPPAGLPRGQIGVISAATLINVVPYDVLDAWITVRDAAEPLRAVPAVAPSGTGLDMKAFQNLGYTAEWFVFAGFAVFMWFRLVRREVELQRDAALGLLPSPSPSPTPAAATATATAVEGAPARTGSPAPPA